MANFNVNLHPSFFQQKLPPQPERRTIDSIYDSRRIPIDIEVEPKKDYKLYTDQGEIRDNYSKDIIKGIHNETKISRIFGSKKNIEEIQNMIRYKVFKNTGGKFNNGKPINGSGHIVGKQHIEDIVVIMRYVYLQYCSFPTNCDDTSIQKEVDKLNIYVLKEIVPRVIEETEAYLGYLRDASHLPEPIPRSLSTNNAGLRKYRSVTEVLGAE